MEIAKALQVNVDYDSDGDELVQDSQIKLFDSCINTTNVNVGKAESVVQKVECDT